MTRSKARWALAGCAALAALCAVAVFGAHPAAAGGTPIVSTISDPEGDTISKWVPPYEDFVSAELTKTASGDFDFRMDLAAPIPAAPVLSSHQRKEIWWFWVFGSASVRPAGYPWQNAGGRPPEFVVYVSWDGTQFTANAIDRRPLLTGGEAIVKPVPFEIDGTIVRAHLDAELFDAVPSTFRWGPFTFDWSGPVGTEGVRFADYCETGAVFNP